MEGTGKPDYKAAVDIGGTLMRVSISDSTGILYKVTQRTKLQGSNTTIPEQADYLIRRACQELDISQQDISAVGVSTCSPFKKKGGGVPA